MEGLKMFLISLLTSGGVLYLGVNIFAQKTIDYYKKEYEKDLHDYNLYALKRNEVYEITYSYIFELDRLMINYKKKENFNNLDKEQIKSEFYIDLDYDIDLSSLDFEGNLDYCLNYSVSEYNNLLNKKIDTYLLYIRKNIIYFDDKGEKIIDKILNTLGKIKQHSIGSTRINIEEYGNLIKKSIKELEELKKYIKGKIIANKN